MEFDSILVFITGMLLYLCLHSYFFSHTAQRAAVVRAAVVRFNARGVRGNITFSEWGGMVRIQVNLEGLRGNYAAVVRFNARGVRGNITGVVW